MQELTLLDQIGQRDVDKEHIVDSVAQTPELIPIVIEGLDAKQASVKYGCAKVLRILSEKYPELLYPRIDFFVSLLDNNANVLKWEGIHVIGNLATVDSENKIDKIIDKYLEPIPGPVLVTAANIIGGAAKIASAKPYLADRISIAILQVENAKYQTTECRNVALGHAIKSFNQFFDHIENKTPVIELVTRQLENPRNGTRKTAAQFAKKRCC